MLKPLRIGIIQRFLPSRSRGGVGYFTHGLGNILSARGHSVTVFSQDPAPSDACYRVITVGTSIAKRSPFLAPLLFPFQVSRLDFSHFDVIHAQGDDQFIIRTKGVPRVRTLHGSSLAEAIYNGIRRYSLKRCLMYLYLYFGELLSDLRADRAIAVSQATCRYYPRIHGVIPNGINLAQWQRPKVEKSPFPTILFVGEMRSRKRGSFLMETFRKEILPRLPNAELWLVCPEKVVGKGLRWFGQVGADSLAEMYRQAWVFCLPSSYEGFGRPYAEAMAAGTPVVATLNAGAQEVLEGGRYGFLVQDGKLGEALYSLLSRQDLRQQYSRLGLSRAETYGWDKVAALYEQVYEGAIRKEGWNRDGV